MQLEEQVWQNSKACLALKGLNNPSMSYGGKLSHFLLPAFIAQGALRIRFLFFFPP